MVRPVTARESCKHVSPPVVKHTQCKEMEQRSSRASFQEILLVLNRIFVWFNRILLNRVFVFPLRVSAIYVCGRVHLAAINVGGCISHCRRLQHSWAHFFSSTMVAFSSLQPSTIVAVFHLAAINVRGCISSRRSDNGGQMGARVEAWCLLAHTG